MQASLFHTVIANLLILYVVFVCGEEADGRADPRFTPPSTSAARERTNAVESARAFINSVSAGVAFGPTPSSPLLRADEPAGCSGCRGCQTLAFAAVLTTIANTCLLISAAEKPRRKSGRTGIARYLTGVGAGSGGHSQWVPDRGSFPEKPGRPRHFLVFLPAGGD